MTKNGQYGKFCVFTQLNSTKTIQVAAVALLDTDVCLAFEACLCGVVVGLALLDTDVCLAAGTWLFGKVVGLALLKAALCLAAKAWLFGEVAGVALLDTDIWLVIETVWSTCCAHLTWCCCGSFEGFFPYLSTRDVHWKCFSLAMTRIPEINHVTMRKVNWQTYRNVLCPFGYKYSTVITVQLLWYVRGGNCKIFPVMHVPVSSHNRSWGDKKCHFAPAPLYRESKYIDIFSFMLTTTRHQCLLYLNGARMISES